MFSAPKNLFWGNKPFRTALAQAWSPPCLFVTPAGRTGTNLSCFRLFSGVKTDGTQAVGSSTSASRPPAMRVRTKSSLRAFINRDYRTFVRDNQGPDVANKQQNRLSSTAILEGADHWMAGAQQGAEIASPRLHRGSQCHSGQLPGHPGIHPAEDVREPPGP